MLATLLLVLIIAVLLSGVTSAEPLLGALQVEGLQSPLAVAAVRPRFSWRVASRAQQLGYKIVAASVFPLSAPLWDSGFVASTASTLLEYGATSPLPPDTDVVWNVTVSLAGVGDVTAASNFSTSPSFMPGAWLGGADTLRTSFLLAHEPLLRARLHASGAGCFHAYVNGARVSAELTPGFAHAPSARMPYATYDVTRLLKNGSENVMGLRIGSCKFGTYGQYCKGTPAQCNVGYALLSVSTGWTTLLLPTSSATWRGTNTSVLRQHLYDGEMFDARLEQDGWSAPGFVNASAWPSATEVDTSELLGPLTPIRARPVVRADTLPAVSVKALADDDGSFVFDVGALMNMAGFCELDLDTPGGQENAAPGLAVSLLHAEGLHANGSVWNWYVTHPGCNGVGGTVNCAAMNATYITRGEGREIFQPPHFSYFGFRYVELRGWPWPASPPTASALTCFFVHSDLPAALGVSFPRSPALQDLQTMLVRTHLSNYVSLPTDCPQREKRGWTGDAQLTAHSGVLNFDTLAFYENWWDSMLDQQRIGCLPPGEPSRKEAGAPLRPFNWRCDSPMVPNISLAQYQYGPIGDVLPYEQIGMGYFAGDPSWEVAAVVVPYELLTQLGDVAAVTAGYDGPKSLLLFFNALGFANSSSNGLITWSYLGDWKAIDTPSRFLVANINYLMAATLTAEIAYAANADADAIAYLALATGLSRALQAKFWSSVDGHWDTGSQSAQILALAFGVGDANIQGLAVAALLKAMASAGGHVTFGASGARFALEVLHGPAQRPDLALSLALEPGYPGWAYFIGLNGTSATTDPSFPGTLWEAWDGPDQPDGGSDNHIFKGGDITPFLLELALGLDFAMRPPRQLTTECTCDSIETPFSLHSRFGFSCANVEALCEVVDGGVVRPLEQLRSAAVAALERRGIVSAEGQHPRALEARLAFTVTETAARRIGAASGWRITPVGNASFAWAWSDGVLGINVMSPHAADAQLELPLSLWSGAERIRVKIGDAYFTVRNDEVATVGSLDDSPRWAPVVVKCGTGTAARHVSGRVVRGIVGGCDGSVLLMHVPGSVHEILVSGEL